MIGVVAGEPSTSEGDGSQRSAAESGESKDGELEASS